MNKIACILLSSTLFLPLASTVYAGQATDIDENSSVEVGKDGRKVFTYQGKATTQISKRMALPFTAHVEEVAVKVGDRVEKGQKLVRYTLLPSDQRHWTSVFANMRTELLDFRSNIAACDRDAGNVSVQMRKSQDLRRQGLASSEDVAHSSRELQSIAARKDVLRARLAATERNQALSLAEYANYFGEEVLKKKALPDELWLVSQEAGTVTDIDFRCQPSAYLPGGAGILVADMDHIQANILAHESEIQQMKVGDEVEVEVPILDGRRYSGKVAYISWNATDFNVNMPSFYNVLVDIDNADHSVKPGFKLYVHVKR